MEQSDEKLNFTRQEIEQHLQSALAAATPNVWEKLDLSVPQDKPQKVSKVLRLERRLRRAGCAAACICLLAGGGIYHYEYMQVDSVIGIDVNPSLRISLNRREKVLKAEALNPDGEIVLDKKLQGESLESALGQVVDSLVEKGYLKEGQKEQAILVSVSGKNKKKAEKVKTEAAANVEDSIAQKQVSAVVYDQTIQVTKELEELAQSYQVSVGKASFIEQLVQENESLSQDVQASYTWMMNQSMESITQEISENEYSVSEQVNVIQVEPAAGASKSKRDKPSRVEMDTKSAREDEETQKERENTSGSGREEEHSLTKEEDRLEAGEAGGAKEQTGDEDKNSREKSKQSAGQKETEAEDNRKDKQNRESREDADADKDKANPEDRVSEGQDAEEEGQNTKGEATSSTVGAENPGKETAETKSGETTESTDTAEDEPENTPEDKAESEKGYPEETIADETTRIPLVEYSQPVKNREEQEDLVVGGNLFNGDSSNQVDGMLENLRPEDSSGDVKAPENPEAGENTQESAESPEVGENTQESVKSPEDGENTQESAERPEVGENAQESAERPEVGENAQESVKSPEAGENTQESAENQKTDEQEDREVSEEAGSQEINRQESVENSKETVKSQETAGNPETGEKPEDAAKDQESAADPEGIEKGQEPDSQKTDNQESGKQKTDNQETSKQNTDNQESSKQETDNQETSKQETDNQETSKQETSNQEISTNPEKTAEVQEAGREETQEEKAGEEQQKEGNLTATQIIRVKVEKKEWKEPEKPVLASQFLGFSHRRLLSRGPGAFDFIVVNPEELIAKREHSKELSEEEVNEDQEWDEDTETDKDGKERFPEAEEEEEFGEAAEEWEAEMGEWLHFGPGYLDRKE